MHRSKRIACVIPARLHSSRFPKKVLRKLGAKPLLQWVYEAALACNLFDEIVVAVDAIETQELVKSFGGKALMTSEKCLNGTERMIEVKRQGVLQADIWVNWQADEPFITRALILDLLQSTHEEGKDIWTLRKQILEESELQDPNVVKVVVDHQERALYFSRYTIPFDRKGLGGIWHKHIGIYAFTDEALDKIGNLKPCAVEEKESLEQLRFLYYGMNITAHETEYETLGIDLEEHLVAAEKMVATTASQVLV